MFGEDLNVLKDLVVKHDPQGKFQNAYSMRYLNLKPEDYRLEMPRL